MKNTFVKVLSFVMALMMVVGTFGTLAVFAAECTHEGTTVKTVIEPTCQTGGYTRYSCTACDANWIGDNIVLASPEYHDWVYVGAEDATCLENSHGAGRYCKVEGCGEEEYEEVGENDKLDHVFVKTKTELTCTVDEAYVYVCKLCENSAEKLDEMGEIDLDDDDYKMYAKVVIEAALGCDPSQYVWTVSSMPKQAANAGDKCVDGLAVGTCSMCGKTATKVLPVEHVYADIADFTKPCTPYKSGKICKCGAEDPDNPIVARETVGHTFAKEDAIGLDETLTAAGYSGWTFAEFAELGIYVNDRLTYVEDCDNAGQYIGRCSCGKVVKLTVPAKGHSYGAFGSTVEYGVKNADNKYETLSASKTLCNQDGVQTRTCGCGAEDYRVVEPGVAHDLKVEVINPTCTAIGYTKTTCEVEGCAFVEQRTDYTDALGHSYGTPFPEKVESDGTYCDGKVDWKKGCERCKNDAGEYTVTTDAAATELTDEQKAHKYETVTTAATCSAPAFTSKVCKWCDSVEPGSVKNVEGSVAIADAHNYTEFKKDSDGEFYTEGFANINWVNGDAADPQNTLSTCVKYGQSVWTCTLCGAMKVDTSATYAAHKNEAGLKKTINGVLVDVSYVAPTCQANGWNAGSACSVCGKIETARTSIAKNVNDPAQHTNATKIVDKCVTESTCLVKAHDVYSTSCCGMITIYTSNEFAAHDYVVGEDADGNPVYNVEDYETPSCTTTGKHARVECKVCKAVQPGSVNGNGCDGSCGQDHALLGLNGNTNAVIAAIGSHVWAPNTDTANYTARVEETCDDDGRYASTKCTRCGSIKVFTDAGEKTFAADKSADAAKAMVISKHGKFYTRVVNPITPSCTREGVLANTATANNWCTKCFDKYDDPETKNIVEGYRLAKLDHNYANQIPVNKTADGSIKNCMLPYGDVFTCTVCDDVVADMHDARNNKADHVWEDEKLAQKIDPTCVNAGKVIFECTLCVATKEVPGDPATGHYEIVDGERVVFDLSCINIAKYDGKHCAACAKIVDASGKKVDNVDNGIYYLKATHREIPKSQTADCTKDGYNIVYCADCGKTLVNTDNVAAYTHEYAKLNAANGVEYIIEETASYIDFVCKFCGEEIHEVKVSNTLKAEATYAAESVFAGQTVELVIAVSGKVTEFKAASIDLTYDNSKFVLDSVKVADDKIVAVAGNAGIALMVANDAEGNAQTVTTAVEGTVLVTVVLKAKQYANGNATDTTVTVHIGEDTATDKANAIVVNGTGNVNGDALLTVDDAQYLYNKIVNATETLGGEYDINGDGVVTLADAIAVAKFSVSTRTAADMLEMIGQYDRIAEYVNELFDEGMLSDMDNDGHILKNDTYMLIKQVEDKLAAMNTINFNSVEDFVFGVMSGEF